MSNFTKNVLGLGVGLALLFGIVAVAVKYIDQATGTRGFGGGIVVTLIMIAAGVGMSLLVQGMTNRTHQSAGDDITDVQRSMSKSYMEMARGVRGAIPQDAQAYKWKVKGDYEQVKLATHVRKLGVTRDHQRLLADERLERRDYEQARRDVEAQAAADAKWSFLEEEDQGFEIVDLE